MTDLSQIRGLLADQPADAPSPAPAAAHAELLIEKQALAQARQAADLALLLAAAFGEDGERVDDRRRRFYQLARRLIGRRRRLATLLFRRANLALFGRPVGDMTLRLAYEDVSRAADALAAETERLRRQSRAAAQDGLAERSCWHHQTKENDHARA